MKKIDPEKNCYGKFNSRDSLCRKCVYHDSCRYFVKTESLVKSRSGLASYERIQNWLIDAADFENIPGREESREEQSFITVMARFFRFLLELDDYSIGIISEVISPADGKGEQCTVSKLGRLHGCSRQAMHRKILDLIALHPELSMLLKDTMYKLGRGRQLFMRQRRDKACAAVN